MDTKEENKGINIVKIDEQTLNEFSYQLNQLDNMNDTINLSGLTGATGSISTGGYTIGANGTSASDWITGGTNTVWTTNTTAPTWNISSPATISAGGSISLQGEQADIEINGRSMSAWMEKVEERLNILTPNPELEKEWDELRRLGERYRKLEKKCKEKAEVWKKLKAMPPPRVD